MHKNETNEVLSLDMAGEVFEYFGTPRVSLDMKPDENIVFIDRESKKKKRHRQKSVI